MRSNGALSLILLAGLALQACAEAPDSNAVAQHSMIGLSARAIRACMGPPARRTAPAQATEVWTYRSGMTSTTSPPWGFGLDFSALNLAAPCDVEIVMTNSHVSQIAYALPDGRPLPSGLQCSFAVSACAPLAGAR